ncbi:MAG: CDP-alcohol phosphatidyltransferase family protein [Oscillospiraceae bacterium]|nr:CDP-alcohol phosphatidyltransferase family protein [Oscillospiraceae bacterium]
MIGFYNYTVWLTYLSLVSSMVGIYYALDGKLLTAVILLMFSGLCDMFDGIVARTKKDRTDEERSYGIQLDSLCDVVCFGAFPAIIGYCIGADAWWQIAIMAFFALAGLIRLAYFNVTEESRQKVETGKRKFYMGVPISVSPLVVALAFCFRNSLSHGGFTVLYTLLLLANGIAFIAPVKVKKPGKKGLVTIIVTGIAIGVLMVVL